AWMKNVVTLTGSMHVDSSALNNVTGLENLQNIGIDLTVTSNQSVQNLTGLSGLKTVGRNVNISSNSALQSMELTSLTSVGGYLQIYNNAVLSSLGTSVVPIHGLGALASVGGYCNIQYNTVLSNLDGLANLTSIGTGPNDYLQISNNSQLTRITGLIA